MGKSAELFYWVATGKRGYHRSDQKCCLTPICKPPKDHTEHSVTHYWLQGVSLYMSQYFTYCYSLLTARCLSVHEAIIYILLLIIDCKVSLCTWGNNLHCYSLLPARCLSVHEAIIYILLLIIDCKVSLCTWGNNLHTVTHYEWLQGVSLYMRQ
jgi:hypothetical protein